MPITAAQRTEITKITVAMFGVAPGAFLGDLVTLYQSVGNNAMAFANALAATPTFKSASYFPPFLTDQEIATKMAANFGLTDTTTGAGKQAYDYFLAEIGNGTSIGMLFAAATAFLSQPTVPAEFQAAAKALENKTVVAEYYSVNDGAAVNDLGALGGLLANVDDQTDVSTPAAIQSVINNTPASATGQTFTLTTGVDTLSNFTGTEGADTFVADNTGTDTTSTADQLDGRGGVDTINVFSDGSAFSLPSLTSIEKASIYDQDADLNLSPSSWDSVNEVGLIRGDGALTLTVGNNVTKVNLTDVQLTGASTDAGVTIAFDANATSGTIGLSNVSTAGNDGDEDLKVTGAALTSITLNTTGVKSSADNIDFAAVKNITINAASDLTTGNLATTDTNATLTITGAGAVSLGTLDADINTINASDNTGGLTAAIGSAKDTVITGSKGNDVITASTGNPITSDALSVDAGDGVDILIAGSSTSIDTAAEGAKYSNFETMRVSNSQDMALVSGITAIQVEAATSAVLSNVTSTQANAITVRGDQATAMTVNLANTTGTSDSVTLTLASATATNNIDIAGLKVAGVESLTIDSQTGSNATTFVNAGTSDITFGSGGADKLTSITVTGSKDVYIATANIAKAVTINASALTGDFKISGVLTSGSTVTATDNADDITVSTTTGTTYNAGAGDDKITAAVADLVATGSDDNKINAGDGTDTLNISTTAATLDDNHFTFITGMEKMTTSTGNTSITTGGYFNQAFANGVEITTGTLSDASTFTYSGGLYTKDATITIDGTSLAMNAAGEDISVTTGSGNDKVTFTGDGTTVGGSSGDGGSIVISTGAGNDEISVTYGVLTSQSTSQFATITAGAGADTITKVGTNGTTAEATTHFVIAEGDSATTAFDKITGFDLAVNTGSLLSDVLDFAGSAAVSSFTNTVDSGVVKSHSVSSGIVSFDDAAAYSSAITIDSTNLSDVINYLATNTADNDVVAFYYDSDGNGSNDATMVFHNGANANDLVELVGVSSVAALTTTATSTTDTALVIA